MNLAADLNWNHNKKTIKVACLFITGDLIRIFFFLSHWNDLDVFFFQLNSLSYKIMNNAIDFTSWYRGICMFFHPFCMCKPHIIYFKTSERQQGKRLCARVHVDARARVCECLSAACARLHVCVCSFQAPGPSQISLHPASPWPGQ